MKELKGKEVVARYRKDRTHVYFGDAVDVIQMSEDTFGFVIDVGFSAFVTVTTHDYEIIGFEE